MGAESSFPFVAIGDADEMIGMSKVNLGEDSSLAETVEKVSNEW